MTYGIKNYVIGREGIVVQVLFALNLEGMKDWMNMNGWKNYMASYMAPRNLVLSWCRFEPETCCASQHGPLSLYTKLEDPSIT